MTNGLVLGMPGLVEHQDLGEDLDLCVRLGLDFVEINANLPHLQPDRLDGPALRARLEAAGLFLTVHAEEDLNTLSFNPRVAEAWRDTLSAEIAAARALGAPVLNLHLNDGIYFTLPDRKLFLFGEYRDHYRDRLLELRSLCERAVGDSGMLCCVENTGGWPPYAREGIELLLESPSFSLTWDTGHDHTAGGTDRPFLMEHADRVRHMHLHDAGPAGCHLAAGDGVLDLGSRLVFAREHGCRVVLETKTGEALARSVEWIRDWEQKQG